MYPRFLEDKDPKERDAGIQMGVILLDFCNEIWVSATDQQRHAA
jgi:hypothetical protein